MTAGDKADAHKALSDQLERHLTERYGPMLGSSAMQQVLGYPSPAAFRQAVLRGTVPIPIFTVPNRRGRFALTQDAAAWLAERRNSAMARESLPQKEIPMT